MKEGWEYKKLGEVATYINGYAFKPSEWGDCGLPIIRIQNLNDENASFNYYSGDIDNKYIVKYGDILISWSASIGVYEWKGDDALLNQHIFKVVFDKSNIDKYYLKFCVCSRINEMLKNVHGATMKHIVKGDFDNTTIPVPPLPIQQQIVSHLDKINEIIDKQRELLKVFDKLEQSIFYDMFGDPVSNEKGWEKSTINEICNSIVRGPFGSALKKEFFIPKSKSAYKIYEQKHAIQGDAFIGNYYISEERYESLKRFSVKPNDIIMSCSGTIGKLFVIPKNAERGIINQALLKFTVNKNIQIDFFIYLMNSLKQKLDIKGCGICNIGSVSFIKKLSFGLPPLSLQQSFAARITSIETQKQKIQSSIDKFQEMLDGAMNEYFNDN